MGLTEEDRYLIKNLYFHKGYGASRLIKEFPGKNWKKLDYKIWGVLQDRVYQTRVSDVLELKERLIEVWSEFGQEIVDEAIDEWRKRLNACVRVKGQHFEHFL